MTELISLAISLLLQNDRNIFAANTQNQEGWYSRKLHEITLCHRMAVYLEGNLKRFFIGRYNVDLEYNKNGNDPKYTRIDNEDKVVRPDIVIHTRTNRSTSTYQHLLVVEAKKGAVPLVDKKKVLSLIRDSRYFYLFGLTISFCRNPNCVEATLYYHSDEENCIKEVLISKIV